MSTMPRKNNRLVWVGDIGIGGGTPVTVQTMWKASLFPIHGGTDSGTVVENLVMAISDLKAMGCDLIRFAVPDSDTAQVLCRLAAVSPIPIIADIHFDYKLAVSCINGGVHKVRINPGNIGTPWKVGEVVQAAKEKGTPIRIGVNGGSLPAKMRGMPLSKAMVESAESELDYMEKKGFRDVVVSLKASDLEATIQANRDFVAVHNYPVHLGLTEAGPPVQGIVKSTLALGKLLSEGIGDTLRISLSGKAEDEVVAAGELLKNLNLRGRGVSVISCPRCGRASFDVHGFLEKYGPRIYRMQKELNIAVMGCAVNGPEEARKADLGITGTGKRTLIFKHGSVIRDLDPEGAGDVFLEELEKA